MKIQIKNTSHHPLPAHQSTGAAGFDLAANLAAEVTLGPLERALIPTGLFIAIPRGYEAQIRPRSGLALKHGLTILNTPGTIDSDYRGEWAVILINLSNDSYIVHDGDRIAQAVISKCEWAEWDEVAELDMTGRGEGKFGHTGYR
jgi:dUTP pyrophosphatase